MKIKLYILLFVLVAHSSMGQLPEDALRMSWNVQSGTARNSAIGGVNVSLGGDIHSIFVNPAGLGLYKTGEVVLTPGFNFLKGKSNFRGTDATADKLNKFNFGTSGIVWGYSNRYSRWTSKAFSLAVNRTANFNNSIYYKGENDYSSYSEAFAEELANSGVLIDDVRNSPNLSLGTKMAVYTYLIDTATINGQLQVVGRPEYLTSRNQENRINTKGGITEVALGFAANMDDKIYMGASLGVPIVNYERKGIFTESDPSADPDNNFEFSRFEENYTSKGIGINGKFGLIFKPQDYLRLGFAIHTPTLYGLKEEVTGKMVTDLEKLFGPTDPGIDSITSDYYYNGQPGVFEYDLISPWKFMVSGSYVFREVEDVRQQKGFISADVEYVTYGSSTFTSADQNQQDNGYYKEVNTAIKNAYKGAFNFRVGGELKFKTIMTRLGFAHYGRPYEDKNLKGRKMNLSGGLGYRNKGMFADLTYVHSLNKDSNFPYRLSDKENTFAALKESTGNVLLTVGFKF